MSIATASLAESSDTPLDTTIRLVTPERIAFFYPLAGPFRRAGAYLVDLLVILGMGLLALIASTALSFGTSAGIGVFLAILFALRFGYGACFEALWNGQTPGKRAMGLRVVSVEGVPISATQAFLRNLLWSFDGIYPFAYLPAIASMVLTRRLQRLGDLAAGTMVVAETRPPRAGIDTVASKEVEALLPRLPARIVAGPSMARALSDYIKHRKRFSPARREEMTQGLARAAVRKYDLPVGVSGDTVVAALYQRVFVGG